MSRATREFRDEGGLVLGKLLWQQGIIESSLGRLDQAIKTLAASRKLLERGQSMDYALLSIDLANLLLDVGRHHEACEVAKGLAALTEALGENKLAEAALVEFMGFCYEGGYGETTSFPKGENRDGTLAAECP